MMAATDRSATTSVHRPGAEPPNAHQPDLPGGDPRGAREYLGRPCR
jgi:hypothetical protein